MHRYTGSIALVLLVAIAPLIGCNQVMISSDRLVGAPQYPPTDPAGIQILRQKPTRAYDTLADLFVEPQSGNPPIAAIENALQQRAAKYGADAVLITMDRMEKSGSTYMGGGDFENTYGHAVRAVAIKYKQ